MEKASNIYSSLLSNIKVMPDEKLVKLEKAQEQGIIISNSISPNYAVGVAGDVQRHPDATIGLESLQHYLNLPHTVTITKSSPLDIRFYIYILECKPKNMGYYYTGQTESIGEIIWQHIIGIGAAFTQKHQPYNLVHLEIRYSRKDALEREKELIRRIAEGMRMAAALPIEFSGFFSMIEGLAEMYPECKTLNHIRKIEIKIPRLPKWEI